METVTVIYSAAIPVGHRAKHPKRALEVDEHLKKELEVVRTLVGTVRRCRVVTVAWSDYDVQTHLDVEPD
jgi:hypothetical protein